MTELLLGVVLVLAVALLIFRIRQNKAATAAEATPKSTTYGEYQAVAIKYSENACDAAKAMTGRRFLARAAPTLPLPKCDYDNCRCKFEHFDDRRSTINRRSPFSHMNKRGGAASSELERRDNKDRRKDSET